MVKSDTALLETSFADKLTKDKIPELLLKDEQPADGRVDNSHENQVLNESVQRDTQP